MTTDRTTALERLADAIAGERLDWHRVEVYPNDVEALLDRLERVEAVVDAARQALGSWDNEGTESAVWHLHMDIRAALAALDSAASDDH